MVKFYIRDLFLTVDWIDKNDTPIIKWIKFLITQYSFLQITIELYLWFNSDWFVNIWLLFSNCLVSSYGLKPILGACLPPSLPLLLAPNVIVLSYQMNQKGIGPCCCCCTEKKSTNQTRCTGGKFLLFPEQSHLVISLIDFYCSNGWK